MAGLPPHSPQHRRLVFVRDALVAGALPVSIVVFAVMGTVAELQDSDLGRRNAVLFLTATWTAVLLGAFVVIVQLNRIHREGWSTDDAHSLLAWDVWTVPISLSLSMLVLGFMRTGFPPPDISSYLAFAALALAFALAVWVALVLIEREVQKASGISRLLPLPLPDLLRRIEATGADHLRLQRTVRNPLTRRSTRAELDSSGGRVALVEASRHRTRVTLTGDGWKSLADLVDAAATSELSHSESVPGDFRTQR